MINLQVFVKEYSLFIKTFKDLFIVFAEYFDFNGKIILNLVISIFILI